ncbi:MAG: cytochrome b561 domain-containing protein [Roseobacter sp.]
MWEWLLSEVDAGRVHDIPPAVSWHARIMVLSWGILVPLAVLAARFFKVMSGQDWLNQLDAQTWWRGHWIGQSLAAGLSILGLGLVFPLNFSDLSLHRVVGYCVLMGLLTQILLSMKRGSKGGPTAPAEDGDWHGDHYNMTPRRRMFEALHKVLGYGLLLLGTLAIFVGLWEANGPRWMWIVLILWYVFFVGLFGVLQRRGMAIDTYQAIWGPDVSHPGNQGPAPKWGMNRPDKYEGDGHVRND